MNAPDFIWLYEREAAQLSTDLGPSKSVDLLQYVRRDPAVLAALPEVQAMFAEKLEAAWKPIISAPKDGTLFLARNADHPGYGCWPMMRRVHWVVKNEDWECEDGGAWLHVLDNSPDPDGHCEDKTAHIPFALAADEYNTAVRYEWRELHLTQKEPKP